MDVVHPISDGKLLPDAGIKRLIQSGHSAVALHGSQPHFWSPVSHAGADGNVFRRDLRGYFRLGQTGHCLCFDFEGYDRERNVLSAEFNR